MPKFNLYTLRSQLILSVALVHAVLMAIFVWDLTDRQKELLLEQQTDHAVALAQSIATSSAGWVAARDLYGLQEIITAQSRYPELEFAMILDTDGQVLAHTEMTRLGQYLEDLPTTPKAKIISRSPVLVDAVNPIILANNAIGWVRIGLGQKTTAARLAAITQNGIIYALIAIIIGSVMAWYLGTRLTKKLHAIQLTADAVKKGDKQVRTVVQGKDEISHVADAFNQMLDTLAISLHKLEKSDERFNLAMYASNDGLWDWDLETNNIYYSPHWKEMLGYEDNELTNELSSWETRVHPDDIEQAFADIKANQNGQTDFYENTYRLKHKKGHWIWVLDRGKTLYDKKGKAIRMTGTYTDITEQKKLRQELLDQEKIMLAQSRHAAMGEMIGMIAHQWRQPITVIAMGANNMLADIELEAINKADSKTYAQSILKQTDYLSQTIDDFRNFFRPNKVMDEVRPENVILEAEKIIGKSLEHNNIMLSIKNVNNHSVKTYSRELLQVYINLLKNSKEALEEHCKNDRRIDVIISNDEENVMTTICDNGGGIDEAIIAKIFDPYFTTKTVTSGTGLGLYMSKTIIEKHLHGTMTAENTEHGICFRVTIPLQRNADET